jgi:hypothetical protein
MDVSRMFIRSIINYGYSFIFGEPTPETLVDQIKATPNGILKKNYGWMGGNVYFINPSPTVENGKLVPPAFKSADIFNALDQEPHGRQAEAGLQYLLGGDFIIARTEQVANQRIALTHHRLFNRALFRPADYIISTLTALDKFIKAAGNECSIRSISTIPLRNSIAKGLFDMDEITPEYNQALQSFAGLTEDRIETLDTTVWTKLKLAYYGWLLNYMPKFIKARDEFISSVDQVISGMEGKLLLDLQNYKNQCPTNIISLSVIQLIREKNKRDNPAMSDEDERLELMQQLTAMTVDDLKPYLSESYIRTLPAVISPADMIMIPVICALSQLAINSELQVQLREDILNRKFFDGDDQVRNIDQDRQSGGLLHRIFLESLRREYPQKNIHDLERSTILWRYCENGMTIADEVVPPGSLIAVMNALQRFDKSIWHNPEVFDPSRFLNADATLNKDLEKIVLSIFTESLRKCPAHNITEYIFQAFIAHIVVNYKLELASDVAETNVDHIRLRLTAINEFKSNKMC